LTLFVDASAAVAILSLEPDCAPLIRRLQSDPARIWSAVARWETFRAVSRADGITGAEAGERISHFERENGIKVVPIAEREARLALDAHLKYGRNKHPAELNMGDCFAYACAKANGASLLYKGDDFARTDLA
jgi:ribonuclease VapC